MSKKAPPPDPAWDHDGWTRYFREDPINSVRTDVRRLLPRGAFGVPRRSFPYIEYLSGLVFGPIPPRDRKETEILASTRTDTKFLEDYRGRVHPLYRQQSELAPRPH
jgi:hypothetical protein